MRHAATDDLRAFSEAGKGREGRGSHVLSAVSSAEVRRTALLLISSRKSCKIVDNDGFTGEEVEWCVLPTGAVL